MHVIRYGNKDTIGIHQILGLPTSRKFGESQHEAVGRYQALKTQFVAGR